MKPYTRTLPAPQLQQGVVLLEALIGIMVFSLGLLALTGLQAAMIKNTDDAKFRAEASFIAQQKLSEIWLNNGGQTVITGYNMDKADIGQLPNGKVSVVASGANCLVTVTVDWKAPGSAQHTYLTNGVIEGVGWC